MLLGLIISLVTTFATVVQNLLHIAALIYADGNASSHVTAVHANGNVQLLRNHSFWSKTEINGVVVTYKIK